jgi:hypothetical protein
MNLDLSLVNHNPLGNEPPGLPELAIHVLCRSRCYLNPEVRGDDSSQLRWIPPELTNRPVVETTKGFSFMSF